MTMIISNNCYRQFVLKKVNECYQEIPQSHTVAKPMEPQRRVTEYAYAHGNRKTIKLKQPALSALSR